MVGPDWRRDGDQVVLALGWEGRDNECRATWQCLALAKRKYWDVGLSTDMFGYGLRLRARPGGRRSVCCIQNDPNSILPLRVTGLVS